MWFFALLPSKKPKSLHINGCRVNDLNLVLLALSFFLLSLYLGMFECVLPNISRTHTLGVGTFHVCFIWFCYRLCFIDLFLLVLFLLFWFCILVSGSLLFISFLFLYNITVLHVWANLNFFSWFAVQLTRTLFLAPTKHESVNLNHLRWGSTLHDGWNYV